MVDPPSIPGLGGISADLPKRNRGYTPKRKPEQKPPQSEPHSEEAASEAPPSVDPNAGLIESLDRLRATGTIAPVESELARTVRGSKYYKEDSRTGLPIIPDPEHPAEESETPAPPLGEDHLA
jgi:hypothetical protein